MADIWPVVNEFVAGHEVFLLTWGPALVLLVLALLVLWPVLRSHYTHRSLRGRIQALGTDSLHDAVIPDGMDGRIYIENLVLTAQGILVLPVKRYTGVLFAADNIDHWTQVTGKRSYRFPNPLPELDACVMAVRALLPGVAVEGRLLVAPGVEFPKGRPQRLVPVTEAAANLPEPAQAAVPEALQGAWDKLKTAVEAEQTRLVPNQGEKQTGARSRLGLVLLLLAGAAGWIFWRSQG
jgi:hypothetical protein